MNTLSAEDAKEINIMTSCDDGIALLLMPQLYSISRSMPDKRVNFYLFHYRVTDRHVAEIANYASSFKNVMFTAVKVDSEDFKTCGEFMEIGRGYPPETYFSVLACKYLPNADRILYIDAADVIFTGDVSEYYFSDFAGNALIVTATFFRDDLTGRDGENPLFNFDDYKNYGNISPRPPIANGFFNAGCFVINNVFLRETGFTAGELLKVGRVLYDISGGDFLGDQAALSAAFPEAIKYFAPRAGVYDSSFRPYNFNPLLVDGNVAHLGGGYTRLDPPSKRLRPRRVPLQRVFQAVAV